MICGLGSGVVESGNQHFLRGPSAPRAQSSAPTLDTSTWCGVPSHPLLPFQPAETEGAGPDTGGHSRATPGPSSVWASQTACWAESVRTGCLCLWGSWMVHGTGWKMRRSHMEGAKPRAQNPEGSGSQLLTPSHQLCFSAGPSVSSLGKWTHWLPDLWGASMTSSSFSEETLLTLTHATALQHPIALPPEASFWKDSPAQQVQSRFMWWPSSPCLKLREKASLGWKPEKEFMKFNQMPKGNT